MRRRADRRGFTLLQILVTASLTGLLAMALMALTGFAERTQSSIGEGMVLTRSASLALRFLTLAAQQANCARTPPSDPPQSALLLWQGRDCAGRLIHAGLPPEEDRYAFFCFNNPQRKLLYARGPWSELGGAIPACDPAHEGWSILTAPEVQVLGSFGIGRQFLGPPLDPPVPGNSLPSGEPPRLRVSLIMTLSAQGARPASTLQLDTHVAYQGGV